MKIQAYNVGNRCKYVICHNVVSVTTIIEIVIRTERLMSVSHFTIPA